VGYFGSHNHSSARQSENQVSVNPILPQLLAQLSSGIFA